MSIYSTSLTSSQLSNATSQLQQYLARFKNRLKATHALWIRQTLSVLQGLVRVCEGSLEAAAKDKGRFKPEMMDTNTLMNRVGGGTDQVNLVELVAYLRESKLARKVSGFTERTAEESQKKGEWGDVSCERPRLTVFQLQMARVAVRVKGRDMRQSRLSTKSRRSCCR